MQYCLRQQVASSSHLASNLVPYTVKHRWLQVAALKQQEAAAPWPRARLPQHWQQQHHHLSIGSAPKQVCRTVIDLPTRKPTGHSSSNSHSSSIAHLSPESCELAACQVHDIVRAVTAFGSEVFLEVISTECVAAPIIQTAITEAANTDVAASINVDQFVPSSAGISQQDQQQRQHLDVQLAHQGIIYKVVVAQQQQHQPQQQEQEHKQQQQQGQLVLQPHQWQLYPQHDLVKAIPSWSAALQQQQAKLQLPTEPLLLQSAAVVHSAESLQAAVKANPSLWCDGTGPTDRPLQGLQYQTLCAGEIECLLSGSRGLAMVQLWVGWDAASQQPVTNPLVLYSLGRALSNRNISVVMSSAPGGLGLTAILCAKAEPWRAWAAHLASFGAQAALVADSPYYKLLIGRVLGYKEENIRHHIQMTCGLQHPSPQVIAAVDKELAQLSKKKPVLPWTATLISGSSSSNGIGSSTAGGRGRHQQQQRQQQQQQLPRSARKKR